MDDRTRGRPRHHLLSVLVENKAGVLARVASLFSRRGYNIFSLAVAPTDDARLSRITIVVDVESAPLEQIVAQLDKLINVVEITELHPDEAREAELLLTTVSADAGQRAQIIALVGVFGGHIVDVGHEALTVMLAGSPGVLDDFEELMRPYGMIGLQRTGRVAVPRLGARSDAGLALAATGGPD
jgi:acetolactate synthase-1/3 small subunit